MPFSHAWAGRPKRRNVAELCRELPELLDSCPETRIHHVSEAKPSGTQILAMTKKRRRRALIQKLVLGLVVLGVGGWFAWQRAVQSKAVGPRYLTAQAKVGPLRETVMATGKFKG